MAKCKECVSALRWVLEAVGTPDEYARRLFDGTDGFPPSRPAREGQWVFEGDEDAYEAAIVTARVRARSRCGFCGGPRPCLRDD
jgi:hypothetical protein